MTWGSINQIVSEKQIIKHMLKKKKNRKTYISVYLGTGKRRHLCQNVK